jgi:catechol 2,3-dioxygenase-like lactoylglutathione lyase family enzyme
VEPRISLITLGVSNPQSSFEFYEKGLGLPSGRANKDAISVGLPPNKIFGLE